jgi:choline dehydrogenase
MIIGKASACRAGAGNDVLPVFRRIEDHFLGESETHGAGGEWRVEAPRVRWGILDAVREAAREMGVEPVDDFNTGDNEGSSYFHVNQKKGLRWSAARGFLKPAMGRKNLRVETGCLTDKLIMENGRVVAVDFLQGGQPRRARCRGEVILCAGAIGSVQVLQRSGIGPGEILKEAGVAVQVDRQGVGRNLQDHLQQRAIYRVTGARTLNETYHNLFQSRADGARLCIAAAWTAHHGAVAARYLYAFRCRAGTRKH